MPTDRLFPRSTLKVHSAMTWDILQHAFAFERAAPTPYTFATVFLPAYLSYYALAVLVQLPHTSLHRATLLPVVFWTSFRAHMSLDLSWNHAGYAYMNQGLSLGMFIIAMRSTVWVFANHPFTRLPVSKTENGISSGQNGTASTECDASITSVLWNAWDLTVNLRNIGWIGPQKIHVPTPYLRVESRPMFLFLCLFRLTLSLFVFDALCRYVRSFGSDTFETPKGGTIFDPALPPTERYIKSFLITLLCGPIAYLMIDVTHQLCAILHIALFQQCLSQWPPLFEAPWLSTSLSSFWGRRWHQLFREPFVVVGGRPLEKLFGRPGTVMGAFTLSGMLHDVGMRGMGRGADTLFVVGFFVMQGVGVLMEHAWRRATGRRVNGFIGWLWTVFWLAGWGQLMVDVWARRGLLGSQLWPDAYGPFTMFLNWISRGNGAV